MLRRLLERGARLTALSNVHEGGAGLGTRSLGTQLFGVVGLCRSGLETGSEETLLGKGARLGLEPWSRSGGTLV
jgi:hypothetical protein